MVVRKSYTIDILALYSFYLLYKALRAKKRYRYFNRATIRRTKSNSWTKSYRYKYRLAVLYRLLVLFPAIGAYFLAEYTFHLYDSTPIDKFTFGLTGMAVIVLVLNSYLTRKRQFYYFVAIGVSSVAFLLWEVYELAAVATGFGGRIYPN
jgi:hypothetical protein